MANDIHLLYQPYPHPHTHPHTPPQDFRHSLSSLTAVKLLLSKYRRIKVDLKPYTPQNSLEPSPPLCQSSWRAFWWRGHVPPNICRTPLALAPRGACCLDENRGGLLRQGRGRGGGTRRKVGRIDRKVPGRFVPRTFVISEWVIALRRTQATNESPPRLLTAKCEFYAQMTK